MVEQVLKKLDKIDEKQDQMQAIQVAIQKDLEYHIKRTDLLEKQVKPMNLWFHAMKLVLPIIGGLVYFKDKLLKLLQ